MDAGPAPPTTPPELIDDLEDGNDAIYTAYGRQGRWYVFNDGKGQQTPSLSDLFKPVSGGANGTKFSVHTTGTNFTDWGGGVGVELNDAGARPEIGPRKPFDASQWDGISFMAKGKASLRLNIPIVATAPTTEGGTCTAGAKPCNDSFGALIPLTSDWVEQRISFAQLAQADFGVVATFSSKQILGLLFQHIDPKSNFDFYIDEVKFFKGQQTTSTPPVVGTCTTPKSYSNGSVTWYQLDQGTTQFHCGNPISGRNPDVAGYDYTGSGQYFGAMNTSDYASAAACGACVEVTRDGSRKVTVTITDECPISSNPKCKAGHIDLSHQAFNQIGSGSEGYLGTGNGGDQGSISWKYVPCPVDGKNVGLRLKEGTNKTWNQVLVEGTRYPLSKVEVNVNGNWATAVRQADNFWEPPGGNMGSYDVRATDINGSTVESTITLKDGDQAGSGQFPACK